MLLIQSVCGHKPVRSLPAVFIVENTTERERIDEDHVSGASLNYS